MGKWVQTVQARQALQTLFRDAIGQNGDNGIVSDHERRALPEFLEQVASSMARSGVSVPTEDLMETAMDQAMSVWDKFNPPDKGVDSKYLSQKEISKISAENKFLGTYTIKAYEQVLRPGERPRPEVAAIRDHAKELSYPYGSTGTKWDKVDFSKKSPEFQEGAELYLEQFGSDATRSWGHYVGYRGTMLFMEVLEAPTGDDSGFVEIYDGEYRPIASGKYVNGKVEQWDANFGDCRSELE